MKRSEAKSIATAAWWAVKFHRLPEESISTWWPDILQEAALGLLEGRSWLDARRRASRFIRNQVKRRGITGREANKPAFVPLDSLYSLSVHPADTIPPRMPVIRLARLIYRLLDKKGKRGRRSAAVKAIVLADAADGMDFAAIASLRNLSVENVKRHYRMGWTLLLSYLSEHVEELTPEQRLFFLEAALNRVPVKNLDSSGKVKPSREWRVSTMKEAQDA